MIKVYMSDAELKVRGTCRMVDDREYNLLTDSDLEALKCEYWNASREAKGMAYMYLSHYDYEQSRKESQRVYETEGGDL